MKEWLRSIKMRTPDQVLVSLVLVLFLAGVYRDYHRAMVRVSSPTGVLMRLEGIETQANATAKNMAAISATVRTGTDAWQKTTTAELDFVNGALPGLTGQLQNNLDYLATSVNQHLNPAIDNLGAAATKLGTTADAAAGTANEVTATLNDHVNPLVDEGTSSMRGFNALLASPDLAAALNHSYGVVGNLDTTTRAWSDISVMARKRLKPILDPDPCHGKRCFWLKTWNGTWTLLNLTGPAVNLDRLITGAPY